MPGMPALIGIVLIGGKSSRMGIDKAEIDYHGTPQRQFLYHLLSPLTDQTYLSCNAEQARQHSDLPVVIDDSCEMGPMGGLLSAFKTCPGKALLSVPCDLPFLDSETIAHLIWNRNPKKVATTYWNTDRGSIEPLLTIWEPEAYEVLLRYAQKGLYSPYRVLKNEQVEIVPALRTLPFKNVNNREAFEEARKLIGKNNLPGEE